MRAQKRLTWRGLAACLAVTLPLPPAALAQVDEEGKDEDLADLQVTIVSVPTHVRVGATVSFQAIVTNYGADKARRVIALSVLSKHFCAPATQPAAPIRRSPWSSHMMW